jgi:hypothetical protein
VTELRRAPTGFTIPQWNQFLELGYLLLENVLTEQEVLRYLGAIERVTSGDPKFDPSQHYARSNAVELDPDFEDLIDRDTHIGFAYDLYGELTKVHLSLFMLRPRGGWYNFWHPDGPRGLPYGTFCPLLPLQLKIAYWLSDVPQKKMGNLVVLPGSHRQKTMDGYDTHEPLEGEHILCVRQGTMTVMHGSLWHRVESNDTDTVRKNIFMTYSPSWICPEDRYQNDPKWLATLPRERRILMRSYSWPYDNAKPPPADFPLFLDRDTGTDRDPGTYREHVELHRRKRLTFHEKLGRG